MNRSLLITLGLLCGLFGCEPAGVAPVLESSFEAPEPPRIETEPQDAADLYYESWSRRDGSPVSGYPILATLQLKPGGTYEYFVMNGLTASGCGTFEGAGRATGRWRQENGTISFAPDSPRPDLAISLQGAVARRHDDGSLSLQSSHGEHWMLTSAQHETLLEAFRESNEQEEPY